MDLFRSSTCFVGDDTSSTNNNASSRASTSSSMPAASSGRRASAGPIPHAPVTAEATLHNHDGSGSSNNVPLGGVDYLRFSLFPATAWSSSSTESPLLSPPPSSSTSWQQQQQRNDTGSSNHQELDRCRRWLSALPEDESRAMQYTREYRDFLRAFADLERAHIRRTTTTGIVSNDSINMSSREVDGAGGSVADQRSQDQVDADMTEADREADTVTVTPDTANAQTSSSSPSSNGVGQAMTGSKASFLQHDADADVLVRVCGFLEAQSLAKAMLTCRRLCAVAKMNATCRCRDEESIVERQLTSVTQILRAHEQVEGIGGNAVEDGHVRVPALLLGRRVVVTNCGDPEFNGVFYCTGSNGNGFVFTKPRHPDIRVGRPSRIVFPDGENDVARPGRTLRCIISKRFSQTNLLWYLSKDVIAPEDNGEVRAGDITQLFCFYADLMTTGDASPDICQYPSQSSVLARHERRWQSLSTVQRGVEPPVLELLD